MSRTSADEAQLPEQAEALLEDWPVLARSEESWEASAQRIIERAGAIEPGSTPDELVAPPLPRSEDEPSEWEAPVAEERAVAAVDSSAEGAEERDEQPSAVPALEAAQEADEGFGDEGSGDEPQPASGQGQESVSSLADIARAVVAERESDAALSDIAKEGLSLAARSRQSAPPPPPALQAIGDPDDNTPTAARSAAALQSGSSRLSERPAADVRQLAPPQRRGDHAKVVLGFVTGALAVAAAAAVYVMAQSQEPAGAEGVIPATARVAETRAAPAREPAREADRQQEQDFVALDDLPTEEEAKAEASKKETNEDKRTTSSAPRRRTAARAKPVAPTQEPAAEQTPRAAPPTEPEQPPMKMANQNTDQPERPSVGEVQGAIASVMSNARACVAGQQAGSKATVTFGSDGRVQGVAVSGPAAGTPAEACIRNALSGARVSPFSQPTFGASITVRPR